MFLPSEYETNDFELAQLRKTIGENVRYWRQRLGISQEELAFKLGYRQEWIAYLESGKRSIKLEFLPRLQAALNLDSPMVLLTDSRLHRLTEIETAQIAVNPQTRNQYEDERELKKLAGSLS